MVTIGIGEFFLGVLTAVFEGVLGYLSELMASGVLNWFGIEE